MALSSGDSKAAAALFSWNFQESFCHCPYVCDSERFPTRENAYGKTLSNKTILKELLERENS